MIVDIPFSGFAPTGLASPSKSSIWQSDEVHILTENRVITNAVQIAGWPSLLMLWIVFPALPKIIAGAATSQPTIYFSVLLGELVTTNAVCLVFGMSEGLINVIRNAQRFEMVWVYAGAVVAFMVDLVTVWDEAD